MDRSPPPLVLPGPDPSRVYTPEEEARLATQLHELLVEVHSGNHSRAGISEHLLCEFHRRLFAGVRDHAGIIRKRDFGSETLTYGPNRSIHRDAVPETLDAVFRKVRKSIASFDDNPEDPDYELQAIRTAAWAHAEIVKIHPFEDGNGRTSRLIMNWFLVRVGLRPIALEAVRQEYLDCLNHYYRNGDIDPLVDLFIGLYPAP